MDLTLNLQNMFDKALAKVVDWVEAMVKMLPNLALALFVVLLSWVLAKLVCRIVERAMRHISSHREVRALFVKVSHIAVIAGGIAVALGILNLNRTVTSLLAGIGIIGLALGFAFKDIASNFMAGILLTFHHQFTVGDLIETSGFFGRVESINLRATRGRALQGQLVVIPNSQLLTNIITNYSSNVERRVDLACGVAYGDDLQKVEQLAVQAVEGIEERLSSRPVEFFYEEFGSSSINFKVRFWIHSSQKTFLSARSKAVKAIKKTFDENGITIPFPIRTLDFGVVGGETLAEHLKDFREVHAKDETQERGRKGA